jgi:hypothetical protein
MDTHIFSKTLDLKQIKNGDRIVNITFCESEKLMKEFLKLNTNALFTYFDSTMVIVW